MAWNRTPERPELREGRLVYIHEPSWLYGSRGKIERLYSQQAAVRITHLARPDPLRTLHKGSVAVLKMAELHKQQPAAADVLAERTISFVRLHPITETGKAWLANNVDHQEWQWLAGFLVIEARYSQPIVDGARHDGLTVLEFDYLHIPGVIDRLGNPCRSPSA